MSVLDTTSAGVTRVSLRDLSESSFRALMAHGASYGEARVAARMVLQTQFTGGDGLGGLLEDLAGPAWSRTPVLISVGSGVVELGSPEDNRLLREAPLGVEFVASGDEDVVQVRCEVADPRLVDAVLLESTRVTGATIAAVVMSGAGGSDREVRVARPDGRLEVATLTELPSAWVSWVQTPGIVALRDVDVLGELDLSSNSAQDRAQARADAAKSGIGVDAAAWREVYAASRLYLVPD